jgi:hypothetical protein
MVPVSGLAQTQEVGRGLKLHDLAQDMRKQRIRALKSIDAYGKTVNP